MSDPTVTGPRPTDQKATGPKANLPKVTGPKVTGPKVTGPTVTDPRISTAKVVDPNLSVVTFGNIGPYSGVLGATFAGLQETLQVWAKHTNANGGLNGHAVRVISADTGGDPSNALTLAKKMVQDDKIIAFLDNYLLFEFDSIAKYAASVNVPLIGGDAANPDWFTTPIAFPQGSSFKAATKVGTRHLADKGAKRIGVVYCTELALLCKVVNDLVIEQAKSVGAEVVYTAPASLTAPSYTSNCLNAKKAGVTGLWLFLDGAGAGRVARDCAAQGFTPVHTQIVLGSAPGIEKDPNFQGAVLVSPEFPTVVNSTPATAAYHRAFAQYAPSMSSRLTGTTAAAWVAGQLALEGAKNLDATPTSVELITDLRSIKNNTLGGLTIPLDFTTGRANFPDCAFLTVVANFKLTAPQGLKLAC